MIFAKYFEYYTIILRGPFFRGHTIHTVVQHLLGLYQSTSLLLK